MKKIKKILFSVPFFKHVSKAYLYSLMRGFSELSTNNKFTEVFDLKAELENHFQLISLKKYNKIIVPISDNSASLVIKQLLIKHFGGITLHKNVQSAWGGGFIKIHILPPSALKLLYIFNIPVNQLLSRVLWSAAVFGFWCYGLKLFLSTLRSLFDRHNCMQEHKDATFFFGLSKDNVPSDNVEVEQKNVLTWFLDSKFKKNQTNVYYESSVDFGSIRRKNCEIRHSKYTFDKLNDIRSFLLFMLWGIYAAFFTFLAMLFGNWRYPLLFAEVVRLKCFILNRKRIKTWDFWFHHESFFYRPLWTHYAENCGCSVYLYFYSTNNHVIGPSHLSHRELSYWNSMNWNNYVVWNRAQQEFIRKYTTINQNINIVGSLPYSDNGAALPNIGPNTIAVFDITPKRMSIHRTIPQMYNYVTVENWGKFLIDIVLAARDNDCPIIIKSKKWVKLDQIKHLKTVYVTLQSLYDRIYFVDSGISAHRIIGSTDMAINFPYTSTAIIAQENQKPSVFYDPTDLLPPSPIEKSIPIVSSQSNLSMWIKQNIREQVQM